MGNAVRLKRSRAGPHQERLQVATVIEPGVIGSDAVRRVTELTGLDEDAVLGKLLRLWTGSQSVGKAKADWSEVAFWLGAKTPEQSEGWVMAFADPLAGFLKVEKNGEISIAGNARHIKKQKIIKKVRTLAARKRWEQGKKTKPREIPKELVDSDSNANASQFALHPESKSDALTSLNQAKLNQAKPSNIYIPPTPQGAESIPSDVKAEWETTLAHCGRKVNWARDEVSLYRVFQRVKDWSRIRFALAGFRYEQAGPGYDPARYLFLRRLEDAKSFEFLEGLGELRPQSVQTEDGRPLHPEIAKLRAMLAEEQGS